MNIPLILFFSSLCGVIVMIGRKLPTVAQMEEVKNHELSLELPYLKEAKKVISNNTKKYGYVTLVTSLRLYFKTINFFKHSYLTIEKKIKDRKKANNTDKNETSKFLKIIGEYKGKIREIKHQIREEESL